MFVCMYVCMYVNYGKVNCLPSYVSIYGCVDKVGRQKMK